VDGHGRPVAGGAEQVHVAGREEGAGPGPPGGPAAGGPDGQVEALLAEAAIDHGDGHAGPAVVVGWRYQPGRPRQQPGLDLGRDQQRNRPGPVRGPVVRGCGQPGDARPPIDYPPSQGPHVRRVGNRRDQVREDRDRLGRGPCGGRGRGPPGGLVGDPPGGIIGHLLIGLVGDPPGGIIGHLLIGLVGDPLIGIVAEPCGGLGESDGQLDQLGW
jgi:hypothetical protein